MTEQKELRIVISDLSVDEVNALLAGLQELPAKVCNPITEKVRRQAIAQVEKYKAENEPQEVSEA